MENLVLMRNQPCTLLLQWLFMNANAMEASVGALWDTAIVLTLISFAGIQYKLPVFLVTDHFISNQVAYQYKHTINILYSSNWYIFFHMNDLIEFCLHVATFDCGNGIRVDSCDLCQSNCGGDCIYKYSYGNWTCHPTGNQMEIPS